MYKYIHFYTFVYFTAKYFANMFIFLFRNFISSFISEYARNIIETLPHVYYKFLPHFHYKFKVIYPCEKAKLYSLALVMAIMAVPRLNCNSLQLRLSSYLKGLYLYFVLLIVCQIISQVLNIGWFGNELIMTLVNM
jgi:uncharacterized protein YggT (Ycf19 family)